MIIDDDRWIELDDMLQLFRAWQVSLYISTVLVVIAVNCREKGT